jgi:Rad9
MQRRLTVMRPPPPRVCVLLKSAGNDLLVEAFPERVRWRGLRSSRCQMLRDAYCQGSTNQQRQSVHAPRLPQLILRAINSARSAFLAVTMSSNFFESYNVFGAAALVQAGVLLKVRRAVHAHTYRCDARKELVCCFCCCCCAAAVLCGSNLSANTSHIYPYVYICTHVALAGHVSISACVQHVHGSAA